MSENIQAVMTSVESMLNDTNLNPMVEAVGEQLVSFGYTPNENDAWMIAFSVQKAVNHVLNEINQSAVPNGLFEVTVDMICGEVLNAKFLSGQLDLTALDLDGMIQSVKQGDTQVNFSAEGSDEAKLKGLLSWLIQGKGSDLTCYRKMRW